MRKNKPRYLLDECIQTKDEKIREKFGFVNSTEIIPSGSTDDEVLRAASRRKLIVITKDVQFVFRTLIQGKPIIYQNNKHERILLELKSKPKIEKNCHLKYRDFTTSHILHSNNVVIP